MFVIFILFCRFESSISGDYKFCFDNTFSTISNKVVFFEIFVEDGKDDDDDDADDDKLTFEGENIQDQLDMTVEEFTVSKNNKQRGI